MCEPQHTHAFEYVVAKVAADVDCVSSVLSVNVTDYQNDDVGASGHMTVIVMPVGDASDGIIRMMLNLIAKAQLIIMELSPDPDGYNAGADAALENN